MTAVNVNVSGVGSNWRRPCQQAVTDLNALFKRSGIKVVLGTTGSQGPTIIVKTDPSIQGNAVHGRTTSAFSDSGQLLRAEIRLPIKVTINTPKGIRDAGPGVLEVIAGHEFVHALGHDDHNSHLMGQTMSKVMGDTPAGDKLNVGSVTMPPLVLSTESITALKAIWK
ncbi:MAG: zinc metalloprotease [Pirellulaceae bacterium]